MATLKELDVKSDTVTPFWHQYLVLLKVRSLVRAAPSCLLLASAACVHLAACCCKRIASRRYSGLHQQSYKWKAKV